MLSFATFFVQRNFTEMFTKDTAFRKSHLHFFSLENYILKIFSVVTPSHWVDEFYILSILYTKNRYRYYCWLIDSENWGVFLYGWKHRVVMIIWRIIPPILLSSPVVLFGFRAQFLPQRPHVFIIYYIKSAGALITSIQDRTVMIMTCCTAVDKTLCFAAVVIWLFL